MSDDHVFVSPALLRVMREAARRATALHEPFITMRAVLLALLDDATLGTALGAAISREAIEAYEPHADAMPRMTASRVLESRFDDRETAPFARFNTLAFKVPDGSRSVWLSREAYSAFCEGARRVEDGAHYLPVHLACGIAADAIRSPGLLSELGVSPGKITEAIGARS